MVCSICICACFCEISLKIFFFTYKKNLWFFLYLRIMQVKQHRTSELHLKQSKTTSNNIASNMSVSNRGEMALKLHKYPTSSSAVVSANVGGDSPTTSNGSLVQQYAPLTAQLRCVTSVQSSSSMVVANDTTGAPRPITRIAVRPDSIDESPASPSVNDNDAHPTVLRKISAFANHDGGRAHSQLAKHRSMSTERVRAVHRTSTTGLGGQRSVNRVGFYV
jgi:hypothetical protein